MDKAQDKFDSMAPKDFRQLVRQGKWEKETLVCSGYAQAHLAVLPKDLAYDFLVFCHRNQKAFPVLEVTDAGDYRSKLLAPGADLRTDLPKYYVYKNGKRVGEAGDIKDYWRDDLVCFLLGCALRIDVIFRDARVEFRKVGGFATDIQCTPAGRFRAPLIVQCYLFKDDYSAFKAVQLTSRLPAMHGSPVHIGDPTVIGIKDLCHPEYPPATIPPAKPGETALFWACAVSLHTLAAELKPPLMILNAPGYMFVTDRLTEELALL